MEKKYEYLMKAGKDSCDALERLEEIVTVLRRECPWDKVQTHQTLTTCMIEEAYETVDAIEKEDFTNLREELGDVMLQVVFHSNLSQEEGKFSLTDVINEECEKMIRRHPHIFYGEEAKTVDKVLEKWENIKSKEHGETSYTQRLLDVPSAFPALMKSNKVQKRAADAGFDWDDIQGPVMKVGEELEEFKEAFSKEDRANMEEELGDLLFAVVNVARFADIDPEQALNKATDKFIDRFRKMEVLADGRGEDMKNMNLEQLDSLWNEVKK